MTIIEQDNETRSPFLPNTKIQFAWDSTSLGYLKTCPRLYQYIMIDGWGSRDESIHLRFGIEYHKALEDYDRFKAVGLDHEASMRRAIHELLIRITGWRPSRDTKAGKYKNEQSIIRIVIDYLDHFEIDPTSTVILSNGKPATELSFRFELDWGPTEYNEQPYILCGHLDRVVNFGDDMFVMDRKTSTSTISDYYFKQYSPNNQMTLYTIASQIILDTVIKGVIIDAGQVLIDSSRFVRGFTFRTQDQLDEWLADLRFWLALAEQYAVANYWPMNDTACDKFGGCRFREVCSKSPKVRETYLKSDFDKLTEDERWNPLKAR